MALAPGKTTVLGGRAVILTKEQVAEIAARAKGSHPLVAIGAEKWFQNTLDLLDTLAAREATIERLCVTAEQLSAFVRYWSENEDRDDRAAKAGDEFRAALAQARLGEAPRRSQARGQT